MRVVIKWSAGALFGLASLVLTSGSVFADESAGRETRVSSMVTSNCPKGIAGHYPWMACRTTATGRQVIAGPTGNDTWENSRITLGDHPFVNGDGYFGPVADR